MHGRVKKDVVELPPEELEKQRQQVRTARALFGKLLDQRRARVYSQQAFDMTSKALQFHPEFPTLWGYRREILQSGQLSEGDSKAVLDAEMKLLEKALRRSQKVYSIWFHRKWVVERLFDVCGRVLAEAQRVLDTELELCGRLLEVDERNFHCWNHRAHVMGLMWRSLPGTVAVTTTASTEDPAEPTPGQQGPDLRGDVGGQGEGISKTDGEAGVGDAKAAEVETKPASPPDLAAIDLKLSTDLINRNFSNYSAWHLRALLQQAPPKETDGGEVVQQPHADPINTAEELDWVRQGIYTEPNDQSVWLYHHWLTTLGKGCEQTRITHCAILGGELYVFMSKPVCAAGGSNATVAVRLSPSDGDSCSDVCKVVGHLVPFGPDTGSSPSTVYHRTRQLPVAHKRWGHGWKFRAEGRAREWLQHLSEVASVEVEASFEELGSHSDGTPAHGRQSMAFSGPALVCDSSSSQAVPLPALAAILAPKPDPERLGMLQGELARVEELLDIEPDCRWALLARGRLATGAAAGSGAPAVEAAERALADGYERIAGLDPLRKGFYAEARAGCLLRLRALAWLSSGSLAAQLDLSGLALRHLVPATVLALFGVRQLDLSGCGLQALGPVLQLQSLEELLVARNSLHGDLREAFCLPRLRRLDVSGNTLELRSAGAEGSLAPPAPLERVDVSGNAAILDLWRSAGAQALLARWAPASASQQGAGGAWVVDGGAAAAGCVLRRVGP